MDRRFEQAHRMNSKELKKLGIRPSFMAHPMSMREQDERKLRDLRNQRDADRPRGPRVEMAYPKDLGKLARGF